MVGATPAAELSSPCWKLELPCKPLWLLGNPAPHMTRSVPMPAADCCRAAALCIPVKAGPEPLARLLLLTSAAAKGWPVPVAAAVAELLSYRVNCGIAAVRLAASLCWKDWGL